MFFHFSPKHSKMSDYEDMLSSGVSDEALGAAGVTTSVYLKVCCPHTCLDASQCVFFFFPFRTHTHTDDDARA